MPPIKTALIFISLFSVFLSCKSREPQFRLRTIEKPLVLAVLPFEHKAESKESAETIDIIQNSLISQLIGSSNFRIIERTKVNAILKEIELSQTGITRPEAQLKVGKMLNADALLIGNVDNINIERNQRTLIGLADIKRLKIQCSLSGRIILTETSEIITAGEADMKNSETQFLSILVTQGKELDAKGLKLALAKETSLKLAQKLKDNMK